MITALAIYLFNVLIGVVSFLALGDQFLQMHKDMYGKDFFEYEQEQAIIEDLVKETGISIRTATLIQRGLYGLSLGLVPLAPIVFLISYSLKLYIYRNF